MDQSKQEVLTDIVRINTDVTCIKILQNKIIAGIGGTLHVFQPSSKEGYELEKIINVFDGQKVHGIISSHFHDLLIICGGQQFGILDTSEFKRIRDINCLSHWIQTAHWLEDNSIAFALSNNSICLWKDGKIASSVLCPIKCIIYSALLLGTCWDNLTVFSGTVFSEVLIWGSEGEIWHQLKGHKGVIFSITYDHERQRLLTSSDDRSVRVWQKEGNSWGSSEVHQLQELFGHQSRVWRALATTFGLVSIGEDSVICQWSEDGKEMSKVCAHQGGSVWSADLKGSVLVTGGGDGGIMTWTLGQQHEAIQCPVDFNVRRIVCCRGGFLVVSENAEVHQETSQQIFTRVPDICGQIVEVLDDFVFVLSIDGFLNILQGCNEALKIVTYGKVSESTVLSLNILSTTTFLVSSIDGHRTFWSITDGLLHKSGSFSVQTKSKGTSCGLVLDNHYLVGDQDGYLYLLTSKFKMVQSLNLKSEGITGLCYKQDIVWASCKEGRLATLKIDGDKMDILSYGQPRLGMIAGLQVTSIGLILCSFYKEFFTAWSWDQQRPIFRFNCPGGGHRPWSFEITDDQVLKFCYIRHKKAYYFRRNVAEIFSPAIRAGLHLRLVNCLVKLDDAFLLSGGEDGSLRIYQTDSGAPASVLQAHLSSVKTLLRSNSLLLSAGGRAQLILWKLQFSSGNWILKQLHNHMLLDGDKPIKVPWRESYLNPRPDPETRYMALCVLSHIGSDLIFLAACSDSLLRVFCCSEEEKSVKIVNSISHHRNCILNVSSFGKLAVSGSSDGEIALWGADKLPLNGTTPLHSSKVHQGGVTSLVMITETEFISGGDDGTFQVTNFTDNRFQAMFVSQLATQITGIEIFDNFAISTSSGQRLSLWEKSNGNWSKKFERISTIADLQGVAVLNSSKTFTKVCLFGKGSEVLQLTWQ